MSNSFIEQYQANPETSAPTVTPEVSRPKPVSFVEQMQQESTARASILMRSLQNTTADAALTATTNSRKAPDLLGMQVSEESFLHDEGKLARLLQEAEANRFLNRNQRLTSWASRSPVNAIMFREYGDEIGNMRAAYEVGEYSAKQFTIGAVANIGASYARQRLNVAENALDDSTKSFLEILDERQKEIRAERETTQSADDPFGSKALGIANRFIQSAGQAAAYTVAPITAGRDYARSRLFQPDDEELQFLRDVAVATAQTEADTQASIQQGYIRSAASNRALRRIQLAEEAAHARGGEGWDVGVAQLEALFENKVDALAFILSVVGESAGGLAAAATVGLATRNPLLASGVMGGMSAQYATQLTLPEIAELYGYDISTREGIKAFMDDPRARTLTGDRAATFGMVLGVMDTMSGKLAGTMLSKSVGGNLMLQGITQAAMGSSGETLALMASGQELDLLEIALEGLAEMVTVPIEVAAIGGQQVNIFRKRQREADDARALFGALAAGAENSELRAKAPEKYRELVAELTKNGPLESVEIDASALPELFQSGGVTPEQLLEVLPDLDRAGLDRAIEQGTLLSIKTADYQTTIAGTPVDASLREHMSIGGSLTSAQVKAMNDPDLMAAGMRAVEEFQAGAREMSDVVESARTQLVGELVAANPRVTPEMAEAQVTPMLLFAETTASRLGVDTKTFLEQFALPRFRSGDVPLSLPAEGLADIRAAGGANAAVIDRVAEAAGLSEDATDAELREALETFAATNVGDPDTAAEREAARTILNQDSTDIMDSPIPVSRGPTGRASVWGFAEALTDRQRSTYGRVLDPSNPEDFEIIVDAMMAEYENQSRTLENGVEWYTEDIEAAIEETSKIIPELENRETRDLFLMVAAILSPQTRPGQNWENAIRAFIPYLLTGKLATRAPSGAQFGVQSMDKNLRLLQGLIDERGVEGALAFIKSSHTSLEMAEVRKNSGIYAPDRALNAYLPSEMGVNDSALGAYMFGPKVGDFLMNATGYDPDAVTVDLWLGRTYRRIVGTLLDVTEKERGERKPAANPKNARERNEMKRPVFEVAERTGKRPSQVQAVLWYYEQRLYREHGLYAPSENFKHAAQAAAKSRGLADQPPTTDGRAGKDEDQGLLERPVTAEEFGQTPLPDSFLRRPGWAALTADLIGADNAPREVELREELEARGIPYRRAQGQYGGDPERSFLILADKETAIELGTKFEQDSILTRDGLSFMDSREDQAPTGPILRGKAARDTGFFSRMEDGNVFAFQLDDTSELQGTSVDDGTELNQSGLPDGYRLPDLERASPGPVFGVRDNATAYMQSRGLPVRHQNRYVKVDKTRAEIIAQLYDEAVDSPNDPEVIAAYEALAEETVAQYEALLDLGMTFEWIVGDDPYASPADAIRDMQENNHLWVFPTTDGFGTVNEADANNPLLRPTEHVVDGRVALVNDLFRIVHDVYGHGSEGASFGPRGEENAWQAHVRMFSPLAARAMTSETRGQNSWVNYGPFGEQNRANPKDTVFADQKAVLLPEWVSNVGQAADLPVVGGQPVMPRMMRSAVPPREGVELFQSARAPVFHSALVGFLETAKQDVASPDEWLSILGKAPGVKDLELIWTGVYDFIEQRRASSNMKKPKITRNELLGRAQNGFNRLVPTFLEGPGRHENYVEPGAYDEYVELLGVTPGLDTLGPNALRAAHPFVVDTHFSDENIVTHVRATHRGDTFFVEEVQSDLNNALRKSEAGMPSLEDMRRGRANDSRASAEAKFAEASQKWREARAEVRPYDEEFRTNLRDAVAAYLRALDGGEAAADYVAGLRLPLIPTLSAVTEGEHLVLPLDGMSNTQVIGPPHYTTTEPGFTAAQMIARNFAIRVVIDRQLPLPGKEDGGVERSEAAMVEFLKRAGTAIDEGKPLVEESLRLERAFYRAERDLDDGYAADAFPWSPFPDENAINIGAKKALYHAAENGFANLQWTTSQAQGRRWGQQVEQVNAAVKRVSWSTLDTGTLDTDMRGVKMVYATPDGFDMEITLDTRMGDDGVRYVDYSSRYGEQLIGKKLKDMLGDDIVAQIEASETGDLDNPEVRFRNATGEGYINVYDRQMRKALDKIGKPFGARVELVAETEDVIAKYARVATTVERRETLNAVLFHGFSTTLKDANIHDSDFNSVIWSALEDEIDAVVARAEEALAIVARDWPGIAQEIGEGLQSAKTENISPLLVKNEMERTGTKSADDMRAALKLSFLKYNTVESLPRRGEGMTETMLDAFAEVSPEAVAPHLATGGKRLTGNKVWGIEINDKMRESVLSQGFTLYQKQRTETPEFQRWFGESVVRNMDGSPKVLYHGTNANVDFNAFFDMTHMGTARAATDRLNSLNGMKRAGTATDMTRVIPVYASIKRPFPVGREQNVDYDGYWQNDLDMWEQVIQIAEFRVPGADEGWIERASLLSDFYGDQVRDGSMEMEDWVDFRREMATLLEEIGFDGIQYINGFEDPGEVSYVALKPQQIKSVFNANRFDPQNPDMLAQENRGSIILPPPGNPSRSPIINVFKGNDESTVVHEGAHWFLYVYEELVASGIASPDIVEMYDTLKSWWRDNAEAVATEAGGAVTPELVEAYIDKGTTGMGQLDADIYRGMHELFARGFERYMREGKAPVEGLSSLFARFQAWLVGIYKKAKELNVPLTDEVRDVFDRMLIIDQELEKARAADPRPEMLARNAEQLGVSEEEYQNVMRLSVEAQDAAREDMLREVMRPLQEGRREEARQLRLSLTSDVEERIGSQPEHRVIQWLGNERWIGRDQPGDMPKPSGLRFDREMFVADYGLERLKALPRGRRALYETGTAMTPDDLAGWFGFDSGDALLTAIENAPRLQDAVKAEVERQVREQMGDPLTNGEIGDIAVNALQNDKRGDLIAAELRALSKNASRATPRTTRSALREIARKQIAMMPARQAVRSDGFMQAGQRAAVRAQQALAKGDFDAAYEAKRQELLQHSLFRESRNAAEDLRKLENRVARLRKTSTRQKIDNVYLAAIDEIMDKYDFRKSTTQAEERRRDALRAYLTMMEEQSRLNEVSIPQSVIDRAQKTPYRTLPLRELRDVLDALKNIEHTGRFKQRLIDAQKQRDLDETAGAVADAIRENVRGSPPALAKTRDDAGDLVRSYLNLALNADTTLREFDGWDRGAAYDAIKEPIDDAMNAEQIMRQQAAKDIAALYAVYSKSEIADMARTKSHPALITRGDPKASFAKWDLISMALNMGNEQNLARLMDRDTGYGYSQQQIDYIKSQLDERDWDFAQSIWSYLSDTYWPLIAEREARQTGVVPEKVQPMEVVTSTGRKLAGGYYPIAYNPRIKSKVKDEQQSDLMANMLGGRFGKAQTRSGHLRERAAGSGGRVLQFGMGVFHQHVGQVVHDLALSEAVNAAWRILQHPEVVAALEEKGRLADKEALELWVQDTATGSMIAGGAFGRVAVRLKNTFTLSKLAFNISTVLIQMTGITQSMVVVGKRNYVKAQVEYMSRPNEWRKEIMTVSPFMRERENTFHRDIYDQQGEMVVGPERGLKSFQQAMGKLGFWLMQKVQFYGVDVPTWIAGYNQGLDKFKGDEAKARKHADRMVARAQASGLMADRSAFERGTISKDTRQNGFVRLFTTLGSYMFAKANVAYERVQRGRGEIREAGWTPRAVGAAFSTSFDMMLLFTFEAFLYHAIKGTLPGLGDEDDESWAEFLALETALAALGTMPVARDFAGPISGFGAGGAYGAIGETIAKPFLELAQGDLDKGLVKAASNATGLLTGLPSSQLNRVIDGLWRMSDGDDVAPIEFIMGRRY